MITADNITAAETLGSVTVDGPDWIHVSIDADRGAQITSGWAEFVVYLSDAWTPLTGTREHSARTFDDALNIVRNALR